MIILPYDDRAAEWYEKERVKLISKDLTPSFIDGQIASISVVNGLTLISRNANNLKQFSSLKNQN